MKFARLGVNIDHVATLRQQRGEYYPEVTRAAEIALATGGDQVTIHLREDRRHIQDLDVEEVQKVCKKMNSPLNLEMGVTDEMIQIAIKHAPDWVCLVPEKRQERTTEGGLDVINEQNYLKLKNACEIIKKSSPKTKISLFVEADQSVLQKCSTLMIDAVEIHTGEYAKDYLLNNELTHHFEKFRKGALFIKSKGLGYHAGHGLTFQSLGPLLSEGDFEEYNIGHWIISEAIFIGLGHVVRELALLIKQHPLKSLV